jgi:hypothetical protein
VTCILCWNIENFELKTIETPSVADNAVYGVTEDAAAAGRLAYILTNLSFTDDQGADVQPDIFIVIEILTTDDSSASRGILAPGTGGDGAVRLLEKIRAKPGYDRWMLVPPLQTGPNEAVAVFYNSNNYWFTGPRRWPGGNGPCRDGGNPGAYPSPMYDGVLPDEAIPEGLPNENISEKFAAAAVDFQYRTGHARAGLPIDFNDEKSPYLVTFAEKDLTKNPVGIKRTLSLFAIHGPNRDDTAKAYLENLANVADIFTDPVQDQVKVVLGDFNLNLLGDSPAYTQTDAYDPLINDAHYTLGISRPLTQPPPDYSGYRGYFATHLRSLAKATYYYVSRNNSDFYPGYGYVGSNRNAATQYSLDNILARFGNKADGRPCGILKNVTVLNGIVASPFAVVADPAGEPPKGFFRFPLQMQNVPPLNDPPPQLQPPKKTDPNTRTMFPQWDNFGHIRCTSDHMPIVAIV